MMRLLSWVSSPVEAGRLARTEIQPITDVRGSRDFRLLLAEKILVKYYLETVNPHVAAW